MDRHSRRPTAINRTTKAAAAASPAFALRATAGRLLRIHVERFNPALRLYERLGFHPIADRGVYLFMEWGAPLETGERASRRTGE